MDPHAKPPPPLPADNKLITLPQAVAHFTFDGLQFASGSGLPIGPDPVAFGRELLRQGRQNLHALFHCNTQQLNLLCAGGAVAKIECGFSGLEGIGFAKGLRRAVESGRAVLEDYSNLAIPLRFFAGAMNWPFAPSTTCIGSDLQRFSAFDPTAYPNPAKVPLVTDPFNPDRQVGALSPLRPPLAVIHVTLADRRGNAIMIGSEWSRFELSRAARRVVLVADHIVDGGCMRQYPNLVRIPGIIVDAVVHWPLSAWPAASPGVHDLDETHMHALNNAAGDPEAWRDYSQTYIFGYQNLDDYRNLIGLERIEALTATDTGFLLDPYRRWLLPEDEIQTLTAANADAFAQEV